MSRGDYWAVVYGSTTSTVATLSFSPLLAWGYSSNNLTTVPPGATNVVSLAGGDYHAVIARADGTVLAWGLDSTGQVDVPFGLSNVARVSAGSTHSLALQSDGTVSLWGRISGDGNTVPDHAAHSAVFGVRTGAEQRRLQPERANAKRESLRTGVQAFARRDQLDCFGSGRGQWPAGGADRSHR
ncbi:MAG TPA: hypothetical protein VL361_09690 [Candidatus Limnocylindrales bacterium]|nr:hypothetical protein [Candidatus Limnocylindrales bacterium]